MTVPVQMIYTAHTANGSTTTFAYNFKLESASDMKVTLNGAENLASFTVEGVGSDSGGNVVFAVAPAAGTAVVLLRKMMLRRTTDYQDNGDFLAETVNRDFDACVMMIQQVDNEASSALKQTIGTSTFDLTGKRLLNLSPPLVGTEAATKQYVDDLYVSKADEAVHNAQASATAAAGSATAAANSAAQALARANSAAQSVTSANSAVTEAQAARDAAIAARDRAETAATRAETAEANAESAAATAQSANVNIETNKDAAAAAATQAQGYATAAATSATSAGTSATAAGTSNTLAHSAQVAAEAARDQAQGYAAGLGNLSHIGDAIDSLNETTHEIAWKGVQSAPQGSADSNLTPLAQVNALIAAALAAESAKSVGVTSWWNGPVAGIPAGYAVADGSTVSRTTYAALWAKVAASKVGKCTESLWANSGSTSAPWSNRSLFTEGDGSTTFRLPDLNGVQAGSNPAGVFLSGQAKAGTDGSLARSTGMYDQSAPEISGSFQTGYANSVAILEGSAGAFGPFNVANTAAGAILNPTGQVNGQPLPLTAGARSGGVNFLASRSDATYGRNNKQLYPTHAVGVWIVKVL